MKTREELNALRLEVEALNRKLAELTEEEMNEVTGGNENEGDPMYTCTECGKQFATFEKLASHAAWAHYRAVP